MPLRVSGKNLDIGESLRGQVVDRIATAANKFFDGSFQGHVTVEREGTGFRTDCALHLSSGVTLQADGMAHDAYQSVVQTAERIEKRLRRYKQRLKDRHNGHHTLPEAVEVPSYVIAAPDEDEEAPAEFHPVVIAETTKTMATLAVSQAVEELDFSGAPILLFRHAGTGRVNLVYRRADGNIGWVDLPSEQA